MIESQKLPPRRPEKPDPYRLLSDRWPGKLTAKVHSVDVCWRLKNSDWVTIGPEATLVLAVWARRDVELRTVRVEFPDLGPEGNTRPDHAIVGNAESVLVQVPHIIGVRCLKPELEPYVFGQENVAASAMFGGKPEDQATTAQHIRWWGGTTNVIEHNVNASPNIYWAYVGRVAIPKGCSLGVIVRCNVPTRCRARMAGV